jgi:NAD(P)-dependent dehydrogenase (short-subunit alcohol dehydrogenase family)
MTNMSTERPVALVTGCSHGIGAAAALALADAGYRLAITTLNPGMMAGRCSALARNSVDPLVLELDLRKQDNIESVVNSVADKFGRLDVLVNNAGAPLRKDAVDVTREDWALNMSVNLEGTFFMSQAVGRYFIKAGQPGAIVSVTSTHGLVGLAGSSVYGIAKAGISHMTRMLAIEWAHYGIRVNAVAPASTLTATRPSLADPKKREMFLSRIPLGRFGSAEDMASGIVFLAGPQASFITGQTLVIDGGLTAA